MLDVRRQIFETFAIIQKLVPPSKCTCQPQEPLKNGSDAVAIFIKVWLEVRTLILSQNDA